MPNMGHECPRCGKLTLQQRLCVRCLDVALNRCDIAWVKENRDKLDKEKAAQAAKEIQFRERSDNHQD